MAKTDEQSSKAAKAGDIARKVGRGTASLAVWVIGITVLVVAGYFVFRPEGPATTERNPQGILTAYSELVRPYIPPSGNRPGKYTVTQWLEFFDDRTVDWFDDNADKISFLRYQRTPGDWKVLTRDERRSEAVRYLLTMNPLRGGSVKALRMDDAGESAELEVLAGGTIYEISLLKDGRTWKARDLMGRKPDVEQIISTVGLPN